MKKFKSLREKTNLDEAFGSFVVPIPKQTLNGKKIGGNSITVKARTAREAIQKAAKELGVEFKFLKTGKVVKESVNESVTLDEAGPTFIDGVKYQKLKKKKGFNKADWEWTPSKQLYKRVKESVVLDENQVMSAQFRVGDIPNSDLFTSIEKLKTAKTKAEAQKPKVSDPVLVKSLNDVITEIDKTIKDAEKVQATASKAIAKVAPSIKRTFELISRKKYLVASTSDQLDESIDDTLKKIRKLGGSVFTDKLTSKSDKTPARLASQTRGKKTVYFVVTDDGYKEYKDLGAVKKDFTIPGNAADTKIAFDLMSMQGDGDASDIIDTVLNKYKINIAKLDKIVKDNLGAKSANDFLNESTNLKEAFAIEKGAKVKMKAGSNKDLYGTVVKGVETKGFKVNGKQGIMVRWSNKVLGAFEVDQFAVAHMDRKADYQITDDGVRFDN